jgi:hypothetical protein
VNPILQKQFKSFPFKIRHCPPLSHTLIGHNAIGAGVVVVVVAVVVVVVVKIDVSHIMPKTIYLSAFYFINLN